MHCHHGQIESSDSRRVIVDTSGFVAAHMREPRGRGLWAFEIGGQEFRARPGLYSSAKKDAEKLARSRGVGRIYVLP